MHIAECACMANTAKETVCNTWADALNAIDGREYTLDGVHGTFHIDRSIRFNTRIWHIASERGRQSEHYREVKAKLRDDWDSDMSHSDRLVDIMGELGITFATAAAS